MLCLLIGHGRKHQVGELSATTLVRDKYLTRDTLPRKYYNSPALYVTCDIDSTVDPDWQVDLTQQALPYYNLFDLITTVNVPGLLPVLGTGTSTGTGTDIGTSGHMVLNHVLMDNFRRMIKPNGDLIIQISHTALLTAYKRTHNMIQYRELIKKAYKDVPYFVEQCGKPLLDSIITEFEIRKFKLVKATMGIDISLHFTAF